MRKPYSVANAFVVAALLLCGALLTPAAADGPVWQLYRAETGRYTVEGGPYSSAEECLQHTVGVDGIKDPQLSCVPRVDGPRWQLYRAAKGEDTAVEGGPYASAEECLQRADGIKDPRLVCVPVGCGCECPPPLEKQRIARANRLRHPKQHVAAAEPGCGGGESSRRNPFTGSPRDKEFSFYVVKAISLRRSSGGALPVKRPELRKRVNRVRKKSSAQK